MTILAAVLWLLVWQLAYALVGSDLLLSSPKTVLLRLGELLSTSSFYQIIGRSFLRIMAGFLIGTALGIVLGALAQVHPFLEKFISFPVSVIKATPVASFVILALMWLTGRNLSIFICTLVVLPMMYQSVRQGLASVPAELHEMAFVYRLSPLKKLKSLYMPAVWPYFLASLRVALGFVWKAGVAAEVIATPKGTIGKMLHDAKVYLETGDLFAWTFVVILLSVLIEKGMMALVDLLAKRGRRRAKE